MVATGYDLVGEIRRFQGRVGGREIVCRRLRRGKFYIRLQFVWLAAGVFVK